MLRSTSLEYQLLGEGEAVLLIHGSHLSATMLPLMQEPELVEAYQVIRYHRRGFAGSAPANPPFSIADQARDAADLLGDLGIERAHVVGHSYGGVVALQLALDAPPLVQSLVLLEPAIYTAIMPAAASAMAERIARHTERFRTGDARGAVDGFMRVAGGEDWARDIDAVAPGSSEQAYRDAATFFEVENDALNAWTFSAEDGGRIRQPVLYVIGSASSAMQPAAAARFTELVPQAETVTIPDANHSMTVMHPRAVAGVIARFVSRHPVT